MAITSDPQTKAEYNEQQAEEQMRKAPQETDPDMKRRRYKAAEEHSESAEGYRKTIRKAYDRT